MHLDLHLDIHVDRFMPSGSLFLPTRLGVEVAVRAIPFQDSTFVVIKVLIAENSTAYFITFTTEISCEVEHPFLENELFRLPLIGCFVCRSGMHQQGLQLPLNLHRQGLQ